MTWVFPSVEVVLALHQTQIEEYGGSPGLRDRGLLESAVYRATNKVNYEPGATLASIAASLSFGLIKNHAFIDGNKRIGLSVLVNFLDVNGYRLECEKLEVQSMVMRAAASDLSESEWTAWVEKRTTRKAIPER